MTLKEAAVALIKVADQIDKEAMEVTEFVCKGCNHTATLSSINGKRKEAAKTAGENVVVADVTVNDQIHCPACDDIMSYRSTEASEQFYFDSDKKATEDKKEDEEKPEVKEAKKEDEKEEKKDDEEVMASKKASIDYDSLQRYASK